MYYEYPHIKSPDDKLIIWRYMSFTKFVSVLDKKALYFSRATNQYDKSEGHYSDASKRGLESSIESINPDDKNLPVVKKLISRLLNEPEKDKSQFYLSCWQENEHESMTMWEEYMKNDEGVCIQSSVRKLKESISNHPYPAVHIFKVEYYDDNFKTPIVSDGRAVERFIYKRKDFVDDQEIRAIAGAYSGDDDWFRNESVIENDGIYVRVCLDTLIEKIYVCPKSKKWLLDLVKSVSTKYGLDKEVIQSPLVSK